MPRCTSLIVSLVLATAFLSAHAQDPDVPAPTPSTPPTVEQTSRGFDAKIGHEVVHVIVCSPTVLHVVTRLNETEVNHPQPWLLPEAQSCPGADFQFTHEAKKATIKTAGMTAEMTLGVGNLSFSAPDGTALISERSRRAYDPVTLNGERTMHIKDHFSPDFNEAFYGLGQHQSGMFNYRGSTVVLGQTNADVAIPFLVSNKGYAILWNSASLTNVDNRFPRELNIDSLAGDGMDYFVIYGPEMDDLVHQYRNLTGHAPMLPRWAFGFIQSKNRYKSFDEIQQVADRYRREHIPLDAVVQDYYWWQREGDPEFTKEYPDVEGALKKLHAEHVETMISTWGFFDKASNTYKAMEAAGLLVPNMPVYDASSPAARDLYWDRLQSHLVKEGWDSFWLDAAEPEGDAILRDKRIAIGSGALYTNVYPLFHNEGVQDHWRKSSENKRVFLLTRSAFLGQQRVGSAVWSGDIASTYWSLTRQVAGGLNFALSGMPYWTTDIGGYLPVGQEIGNPDYEELYLRWFQFGVFCPIFRSHGFRPENEMWSYPDVEKSLIQYDNLRYRMMPYIYSLAWKVTSADYTIQRPLVMDWRQDPKTANIGDQFMFGPALLVNPVLDAKVAERRVYLPGTTPWYDFWTGEKVPAGKYIQAAAPLERIPLYVKAGSVLPLGPEEEYTGEKVNGPIELRVYTGADGSFDLYQDEGDNYNYEKGAHSVIGIHWSDSSHSLRFEERNGTFPGMNKHLVFHVVWVKAGHGIGEAQETQFDRTVEYDGKPLTITSN